MKKKYYWIIGIVIVIILILFLALLPILSFGGRLGYCFFDFQCQIIGWDECLHDYNGNNIFGSCFNFLKPTPVPPRPSTTITAGGTPESIELEHFDLVTNLKGILNPRYDDSVGAIEVENKGEFKANNVTLDVWVSWQNPISKENEKIGNIIKTSCNDSVSGKIGDVGNCVWKDVIYPQEIIFAAFKFDKSWNNSVDLKKCRNATGDIDCSACDSSVAGCSNILYEYGGKTINFNANLTYNYFVNVSLPITIIDNDTWVKKLQSGDLILKDSTSEYNGGPVKATILALKQPARADIPLLVVASIYNDGHGEILNITNFTIIIYGRGDVIKSATFIGTTFRINQLKGNTSPDGCPDTVFSEDVVAPKTFTITCYNTWGTIKPEEYKRIAFYLEPNPNITGEKTVQIVGIANYEYKKTASTTLSIANSPHS